MHRRNTTSGIDAVPCKCSSLQPLGSYCKKQHFFGHHPLCVYLLSAWHHAHDHISQAFPLCICKLQKLDVVIEELVMGLSVSEDKLVWMKNLAFWSIDVQVSSILFVALCSRQPSCKNGGSGSPAKPGHSQPPEQQHHWDWWWVTAGCRLPLNKGSIC